MLDLLRSFSRGLVAKILIALLILSFAVWGISGSILGGFQSTVIEVGETKVDSYEYRFAYEGQLNALSNSFQRRLTQQEADQFGLRQNVLNQLVAGAVLDENARNMGLGVSDQHLAETIASDNSFSDLSGNFSRNALRQALRQAGLSEEDYIESRKRVALRNQILEGSAGSLGLPQTYAKAFNQYRDETRVFQFVEIGEEAIKDLAEPKEDDIAAFYDENKTNYIAPEYRKLTLLKVEAADLMKPDEVSDEEVRAAYENRKDNLKLPERRQVSQLVLQNAEEAADIQSRIAGGEDFFEVAKSLEKSAADMDLGLVRKSELPDSQVADAAFTAELNKPTETIVGLFGPVIVYVTDIQEERVTPFEEVENDLRNEIALQRAGDEVFAMFDAIEDERGAGETVSASAQTVGLETRTIDAMDASGLDANGEQIADVSVLQELVRQAFQSQPGDDTQAIEIGEDGFLWYEVEAIIDQRQKELSEVQEDVKQDWIANDKSVRIKEIAESILEDLKLGKDFDQILADELPEDSLGQSVVAKTTDPLTRNANDTDFPRSVVAAGFAVANGKVGMAEASSLVQTVFKVVSSESNVSSELETAISEQLNQQASDDILSQMIEDLQARETVRINQQAIELAFQPQHGHH
ncbi:MAG: SurA N-terminal domain-containing protein [Pseudomonadota bacterium]